MTKSRNENGKRITAFILIMLSYAMSVITVCVVSSDSSEFIYMFVICGIFILLLDALVAFMPYITDYYYEYILPKYYEHPIAMRPKAFYAKLAPYMFIFFMLCLLTLCFSASFL